MNKYSKRFNKLKTMYIQKYERYLPTAFDESPTMLEKVNMIVELINNTVERANDLTDFLEESLIEQWDFIYELKDDWDEVKEWLQNEGLKNAVAEKLNEWYEDGELAKLINEQVFSLINQRMDNVEDVSNQAMALASNPLGALIEAGYKVSPDDISPELMALINGNSEITIGKGYYENNRGVVFPLKNVVRDGVLHDIGQRVKDAILGVKVIGAKRGKMYSISYISNGFSDSYGFTIREYNVIGFSTDSKSVERVMIDYREGVMAQLGKPTGVTTRVVDVDGITFIITIDYSLIPEGGGINSSNTDTGSAYGAVIDFSNYVYEKPYPIINQGIDFPFKESKFRGEKQPINYNVKNAILDVKVFGANVNSVYRLDFIANGFESNGKKRYGITLSEYKKDDFEEVGYRLSYPFIYNDDETTGNEGNANYVSKTGGIETITVDNGEIACSVTVDRRLIDGDYLNLNINAPTCMIDPINYFF